MQEGRNVDNQGGRRIGTGLTQGRKDSIVKAIIIAVLVVCLEEGVFSPSFPYHDNERKEDRYKFSRAMKGFYRQVVLVVKNGGRGVEEGVFSCSFPYWLRGGTEVSI